MSPDTPDPTDATTTVGVGVGEEPPVRTTSLARDVGAPAAVAGAGFATTLILGASLPTWALFILLAASVVVLVFAISGWRRV